MRHIFLVLLTFLNLQMNPIGSIAYAQTVDSKNYNLLQSSIDQRALWAKLGITMYGTLLMQQISKNLDAETPINDAKFCLRVGSFLNAVIASTGYERHAVNPEHRSKGITASKLAFKLVSLCGINATELLNPEFSMMLMDTKTLDNIGTISTAAEALATIIDILELTKIN